MVDESLETNKKKATIMLIKNKDYWKGYNQKRKENGYFQQNYQQKKVVKNNSVVNEVVNSDILQPSQVVKSEVVNSEPVVKVVKTSSLVVNSDILQPLNNLQPCPNCQELKTQFAREIEKWKTDYFASEKKTRQQLTEQETIINRIKEKLRTQTNQTENTDNYANLYALINKHKHFQTIQWKYTQKDFQEREFLKSLRDKLWEFN